jgi:Ca2+-binding RTX toxin-like protein
MGERAGSLVGARPGCRRIRLFCAFALASAAVAIVPGMARGSDLFIQGGDTVRYSADPGEANNMTIALDGANYRITDPGVALIDTSVGGCAPVSATEATCPTAGITDISVQLGDMNDTGTLADSVANVGSGWSGDAGNDTLNGGDGTDSSLSGGDNNDTLNAGALGDNLNGGVGNDTSNGGPGSDSLSDDAGNDTLSGNGGSDNVQGGSSPNGADTMSGGADRDNLNLNGRTGDLRVTADSVADDGEAGEGDNVMPDFEQMQTGSGNDFILGGPQGEDIFSGDGNDTVGGGDGPDNVNGFNGDDNLSGDGGNDELRGGEGNDSHDGGAGDDLLFNSSFVPGSTDGADVLGGGSGSDQLEAFAEAPLLITLNDVADDGVEGEGDNAMSDLENVLGGDGPDILSGNASANQLEGGPGDDILAGLGGDDGLLGERGADQLVGGAGTDLLDGAGGADLLRSRDNGPDQASCGAALDTVLADLSDALDADCEQTSTGVVVELGNLSFADRNTVIVPLTCPAAEGIRCKGSLSLVSAKRLELGGKGKKAKRKIVLAKRKISIRSGDTKEFRVNLKPKAARALEGRRKTQVDVKARMIDADAVKLVNVERRALVRERGGGG